MDIVQYFLDDHSRILFLVAGVSFLIELSVMGLSGPLFFFAMSCFITGILVKLGVIEGWEIEIMTVGIVSAFLSFILWKPLKRFQKSGGGPDTSSDMIGQTVLSASAIDKNGGAIRHSGINWNARIDPQSPLPSVPKGVRCNITGVDGNIMIVSYAE